MIFDEIISIYGIIHIHYANWVVLNYKATELTSKLNSYKIWK